jgi:hypothetical protein
MFNEPQLASHHHENRVGSSGHRGCGDSSRTDPRIRRFPAEPDKATGITGAQREPSAAPQDKVPTRYSPADIAAAVSFAAGSDGV